VWPSFYGEMFPASVRLSGMAVGTQTGFAVSGFAVSGFAVSGFAVTFAAGIAGTEGDGWARVGLFTAALCVPPVPAALSARETACIPTDELGESEGRSAGAPADVSRRAAERA
jgi:hypothetical protein